jgi:hypothetical protein
LAAISFAAPEALAAYERGLGLSLELYGDPDRAAYRAFGFERASIARAWLDPRVWARYGQLVMSGRRLRAPGEDTLQLGGDVVVDAAGIVRWVHRSRGPEDRPSVDELVRRVRSL